MIILSQNNEYGHECIAATKERLQQEKEDKLKEKEANKARKAEEKKLNTIRKAQEKEAKKLSRDLKAAEQSRKRVGKGKKNGTVPESEPVGDLQRSSAPVTIATAHTGAMSWAGEAAGVHVQNTFAPAVHRWYRPTLSWPPSFAPYEPDYHAVPWWRSPTFAFGTAPPLQFGSPLPPCGAPSPPPRLAPSVPPCPAPSRPPHAPWGVPEPGGLETSTSYARADTEMEQRGVDLRPPTPRTWEQGRVPWGMPWSIPPPNPVGGAETSGFMAAGVSTPSQQGEHFASRFVMSASTPGASSSSTPPALTGMQVSLPHLSSLRPLPFRSSCAQSRCSRPKPTMALAHGSGSPIEGGSKLDVHEEPPLKLLSPD